MIPEDELAAVKAEITEGTNGQAMMQEGEFCYFANIDGNVQVLEILEK